MTPSEARRYARRQYKAATSATEREFYALVVNMIDGKPINAHSGRVASPQIDLPIPEPETDGINPIQACLRCNVAFLKTARNCPACGF